VLSREEGRASWRRKDRSPISSCHEVIFQVDGVSHLSLPKEAAPWHPLEDNERLMHMVRDTRFLWAGPYCLLWDWLLLRRADTPVRFSASGAEGTFLYVLKNMWMNSGAGGSA
jgi:hypothetical protein